MKITIDRLESLVDYEIREYCKANNCEYEKLYSLVKGWCEHQIQFTEFEGTYTQEELDQQIEIEKEDSFREGRDEGYDDGYDDGVEEGIRKTMNKYKINE